MAIITLIMKDTPEGFIETRFVSDVAIPANPADMTLAQQFAYKLNEEISRQADNDNPITGSEIEVTESEVVEDIKEEVAVS